MTNLNKSPFFLQKVRNQVLKNRKINYVLKYNMFKELNPLDYTFLNILYKKYKIDSSDYWDLVFEGPEDYPWENNTKCYLSYHRCSKRYKIIFVLPLDWLHHYDPTTPIFRWGYLYNTCYLDSEKKQSCTNSHVYLIRDNKFHFYEYAGDRLPIPKELNPPHPSRKGDEDWCITYLDIPPVGGNYHPLSLRSILLIKNVDFSEFDAKVKAGDLKCPVFCNKNIKVKNNPKFIIKCYCKYFIRRNNYCFCVDCRKDRRAIEVDVNINPYMRGIPIKITPADMIRGTHRYFSKSEMIFKMTFIP